MIVIIGGSRGVKRAGVTLQAIFDARQKGIVPTKILSGDAAGPDTHGASYALDNGIPLERHPAKWSQYGKRAGAIRNQEMVDQAQAVIAVWDGSSPGTRMLIQMAEKKGIPIHIHSVTPEVAPTTTGA